MFVIILIKNSNSYLSVDNWKFIPATKVDIYFVISLVIALTRYMEAQVKISCILINGNFVRITRTNATINYNVFKLYNIQSRSRCR